MDKYYVYSKEKNSPTSVCRTGSVIEANSELEAIEKWKTQTTSGKSGRCEVVEVRKIGAR